MAYKVGPPQWWSRQLHPFFHISMLKTFYEDAADPSRGEIKRPGLKTKEARKRVSKFIMNDRVITASRKHYQEYLVKWQGYTEEENTWERAADLSAYKEKIEAYHMQKLTRASTALVGENVMGCPLVPMITSSVPLRPPSTAPLRPSSTAPMCPLSIVPMHPPNITLASSSSPAPMSPSSTVLMRPTVVLVPPNDPRLSADYSQAMRLRIYHSHQVISTTAEIHPGETEKAGYEGPNSWKKLFHHSEVEVPMQRPTYVEMTTGTKHYNI
ncbi:hypothetical protein RJ639_000796 [Escallonia herrerae]|uniref:Chromo domain-containing protein n=1 Tax=Escallonia herrerae TaxID=1293975 RepID=A0AA88XA81_9ASTE|nr:hypothetical protein RJ639_000796 [Escallonia herrerae]